ncbi:MAG: methionine--tRNA ligase subunit beta [Planctomycetota bacterium]|jgi:methionyl-tRNA synthetase|nr:methionine--tRNA ligase subunit beta [Planctomycetota bacterium]
MSEKENPNVSAVDGSTPETPGPRTLPEGVSLCTFDDFARIRLAVAEIIRAEPHPNADKLVKLQIRLGERVKQICAGIRAYYRPEELLGKRIVVVDNLAPRKLRGETSEGMLLAVRGPQDTLSLVTVDKPDFPSGGQVS